MFHNQILELQSQIHYHHQQIEETEQELYQLKAFQSYGDEAYNAVAEAIANIAAPKYLELFKEALLSLFDNPTTTTTTTTQEEEEKEYVEYISAPVCYDPEEDIVHIGFKDQELAEEWAHQLHHLENYGHRYVIEESEHLQNYPIELKIKGVTIEDARTLNRIYNFSRLPDNIEYKASWKDDDYQSIEDIEREDPNNIVVYPYSVENEEEITPPSRPDLTPVTYTDITPDIVYSSEGRCYLGFSSRARASTYGQLLKEVWEFTTTYKVDKPTIMHNHKWELKMWCSKDNAVRLAPLNLKKELDHPDNQVVTKTWVQKEVPSSFEDKSYPPISLTEVEVGDLVSRSSKGESRFKVLETRVEGDGELYALVECLVNPIFPNSVGQKFSLKEIFLVEKCEDKEEF